MKISVIVPYHNAAPWLVRCLNSLTDNEGDFEFILVNDRSDDAGPNIVRQYAAIDERFVVLDNERGPGVSGARNTGLDICSGDWVTFLDADDKFTDHAFDTFSRAINANKHAAVIQFNHLRHYKAINKTVLKYTNEAGVYTVNELENMKVWFGVWNKLFRDEFVKDIRFDERTQYGEDGLFVLECLGRGASIYHAEKQSVVVVHNFENPNSLSRIKKADDLIKQVRLYEEFLFRQERPEVRIAVCKELSRLWASETFALCIGGKH